jgi:hypothetical protein
MEVHRKMTYSLKYSANDALKVIDGPLSIELNIHRFDAKTRTKSQLFGVNGPLGKQFGVVLGNTDIHTGHHPAQQTRVLLERCNVPTMAGVEAMDKPYNGSRIKKNQDSKIAVPNHVSFLVADESALARLLRWYAKA